MGAKYSKQVRLENIDNSHIIIAVVGLTGVGKSTFINLAAGKQVLPVGHGLTPNTCDVQHVECQIRVGDGESSETTFEHKIIFVETPGFDSELDELKMRDKLNTWLNKASSHNLKISGVLYLHRITDTKLSNPPIRHLVLLEALCKESIKGFPKRVVLVTTMWDVLKSEEKGSRREQELQKHWDELPPGSAVPRVMRFDNSSESAISIVSTLMRNFNLYQAH